MALRLKAHMYRITYVDGAQEELEFTAYDMDRAVQAIANRALESGHPAETIITEDGRLFRIKNPNENVGTAGDADRV